MTLSNFKTSNYSSKKDQIEEEKQKLREEFEEKIREIQEQYEEEKMSKEALIKQMDAIKLNYDSQINSLDIQSDVDGINMNGSINGTNGIKPKSGGKNNNRKVSGLKKNNSTSQLNNGDLSEQNSFINSDLINESNSNIGESNDPEQRLLKLQGNFFLRVIYKDNKIEYQVFV